MAYRVAIDVGGTFTDFVLVDDDGHVSEAKTPTTPSNPGRAIPDGLEQLARGRHVAVSDLLSNCSLVIHGTTVALNTLIQHSGARTGLICTDGFRDTLEIRLGYRDVRYDFAHPPPPLLVPRHLRLPVRERVGKSGNVLLPLEEEDVHRALATFKANGVEAVAICLLWSFSNPVHEQRVAAIVRDEIPHAYVSLSCEVAPQIREYDRTSTTVLNAYIGRLVAQYLNDTEQLLRSLGFGGEIRYIQSNGGVAAAELIRPRPILALNSGPAAGPAAGLFFAGRLQHDSLITMDMGGTSFDACLIDHGVPDVASTTDVHRYRIAAPMINIKTIGAGGGSIAWIDHSILRVGPQSAGAEPGPACYMRGGTQATVTDADLVLGYLNQEALLGGRFRIDAEMARRAISEEVAQPLGLSLEEAALGVFEIVNRNMANAISQISLERGHDPRDFTLVAAGGQGGVHAGELARELSIPTVVIPRFAATFCAFGALASDLRHDYRRSFTCSLADLQWENLERAFQSLEHAGISELQSEGCSRVDIVLSRRLEMRYAGQIYEVTVDVSQLPLGSDSAADLLELLHRQHEKEYTYRLEEGLGEIINLLVTAIGRLPRIQLPIDRVEGPNPGQALTDHRRIVLRGLDECRAPVYEGTRLRPGNVVVGPAVVEEPHTTIVVFPSSTLELTTTGSYLMRFPTELMN